MASPGFRSNPKLYDRLLIDGLQVPGEWTCPQLSRALDIKHPKSDGKDEGSPRIAGLLPASGVILTKLDTDKEESDFEALRARIFPLNQPTRRNQFSVENIHFNRNGIRALLITGIDDPPSKGGEEQHVAIHWQSVKATGTGKGGTRKPKPAQAKDLANRPTALDITPAKQVEAAGGR